MNIYESITKIMEEGYAITKSKRNQQQGFMYRGIDDVMNTFHPLLSKYHVFVVPEVIDQQRQERVTKGSNTLLYSILKIRYTFFAEDGTSVSAVVIGEGMDSGDKASNKAMSVGMKYAMFQVFCIPTEDMEDPDAATPPPSYSRKSETPQIYHCQRCGKAIEAYRSHNGVVRPQKHVDGCLERFGEILCLDCISKREANENAD